MRVRGTTQPSGLPTALGSSGTLCSVARVVTSTSREPLSPSRAASAQGSTPEGSRGTRPTSRETSGLSTARGTRPSSISVGDSRVRSEVQVEFRE